MTVIPIKRALVSVYDKTGLEELGRGLAEAGVEIVSTGSTAARLRDAGVTGTVTVGFTVDTLGTTRSAPKWVLSTTDIAFVQPALDAVKVLRFRPAQKDGRKVPAWVELPITFTLGQAP
ncbi:MAG TPA: TonB family protein [Geminicoccaceae bacterium]